MNRRTLLASIGTLSAAGLAGCTSELTGGGEEAGTGDPATDGTPAPTVLDRSLPIARDELQRGAPKDAIPAITDPAFGDDWQTTDFSLDDDAEVLGVTRNGEARAYPLAVLNWHEVVNDEFGGPLLVTYCPLCGSGVVAERFVAGEPTDFGVSGYLWRSDLVMYDEATESLWSQIAATAINGPQTGADLTLVPSSLTTWGAWRGDHPETRVLLPPPESGTITDARARNYARDPYENYDEIRRVGITGSDNNADDRLHPKTVVVGVSTADAARAYPLDRVESAGIVTDSVGDLPVVVTTDPGGSLVAYDRRVDGESLAFAAAEDDAFLAAGGSRWRVVSGEAVDGPYEGRRLSRANDRSPLFWFAWAEFNPDTGVYGE
ncbi:DUF3179 domain-containing protein [Halorientalis litorea]|uniref:DUF3179 domain-containing protein n=1 Tax=Halorientalis litorea TaxID=2931977 RepID=UPI001FF363F3|nr:DUF3179 domain-containing protein [Halorientalis litorea]